jgi:hypothetical protein
LLASIVVLYVASAEVDATTTATIVRALDQALGAPTQVSVRPTGPPPSDRQRAQACSEPQVGGVAVVSWASHERRAATVLVRHCGSGGEDSFSLAFAPGDPPTERWRSIGFVIASALHAASPDDAEPPIAAATPTAEAAPAPTATVATSTGAGVASASPVAAVIPRVPATPRGQSLDAFALVGVPIAGDGGGFGGGLAFRQAARSGWGVRFGLHGRSGQIPAAQASLFEAGLAAGVTRTVLPYAGGAWPALGVRLDAALLYESITHFSSDDPEPVRRQRFYPAADGEVELTWPFGPVDLQAGAGLQAALSDADVVVHGKKVGEIPRLRAIVDAGFRVEY